MFISLYIYIYKILRPYAGSKVPEKLPCYERGVHMVPWENKLKLFLEHNDVSLIFQKGKFLLEKFNVPRCCFFSGEL